MSLQSAAASGGLLDGQLEPSTPKASETELSEMAKPDVFMAASDNDVAVSSEYANLRASEQPDSAARIDAFRLLVDEGWQPSINMRLHVAARFVRQGGYLPMKAYASRMAALSYRDEQVIVAEKLGPWLERRIRFESFFENGERLIYAAVNVGGGGPARYAPFSVVFDRSRLISRGPIAIVRGDSLKDYNGEDGLPAFNLVLQALCSPALTGQSAALKHKDQIGITPPEGWFAMTCSDAAYQEALLLHDPSPADVLEIRVSKLEYDRLWDLAFMDFSRKLDSDAEAAVDDFAELLEITRGQGIPIRTIAA